MENIWQKISPRISTSTLLITNFFLVWKMTMIANNHYGNHPAGFWAYPRLSDFQHDLRGHNLLRAKHCFDSFLIILGHCRHNFEHSFLMRYWPGTIWCHNIEYSTASSIPLVFLALAQADTFPLFAFISLHFTESP